MTGLDIAPDTVASARMIFVQAIGTQKLVAKFATKTISYTLTLCKSNQSNKAYKLVNYWYEQ